MHFWENLIKLKFKNTPDVVGAGQVSDLSQVSGRRSNCKEASPGMVPWPPELKLCREMGTHPGRVIFYVRTGYSNPQGQGAIKIHVPQTVCGLPS